jgi:hypothetical protein
MNGVVGQKGIASGKLYSLPVSAGAFRLHPCRFVQLNQTEGLDSARHSGAWGAVGVGDLVARLPKGFQELSTVAEPFSSRRGRSPYQAAPSFHPRCRG